MQTYIDKLLDYIRRQAWVVGLGLVVIALSLGVGLMMGGVALLVGTGLIVVVVAVAIASLIGRRGGGDGSSPWAAIGSYVAAAVVVGLLIQLVPYGRDHSNPPVVNEPDWATPRTRELMVDACFGCHSNEVVWPWYSNVAPVSWVVTQHVDEGRRKVNYSEFGSGRGEADETVETIREGEMPPAYYTALGLHPEAKLTDAELEELIAGLRATPGLAEH